MLANAAFGVLSDAQVFFFFKKKKVLIRFIVDISWQAFNQ